MKWSLSVLLLLSQVTLASNPPLNESVVTSMVPKGRVVEKQGRDYIVKTPAGTKIEVEFLRDGGLEEASGANLNKGDNFEPGQGLISLGTAAQAMAKAGQKASGHWNLDRDPSFGWVYELETVSEGENATYMVDAKHGTLIRTP